MSKNFINSESVLRALLQVCFGMLGALIVLMVVHKTPPVIAMVNITGLEDSFIRETSRLPMTEAEKKQKVERFAKTLKQAINRLAGENHFVIVPAQAVLSSDSPDLTQEVAREIKKGINQ